MIVHRSHNTAVFRAPSSSFGSVPRERSAREYRAPRRRLCLVTLTALSIMVIAGCTDDDPALSVSSSPAPTSSSLVPTGSAEPASPATTPTPSLGLGEREVVAKDLAAPWSVVEVSQSAGSQTGLLVSLRDSGEIVYINTNGETHVVHTFSDVVHQSEDGLLGLAFHQDHGLYAYYSTAQDNRIVQMDLTWSNDLPVLSQPKTILTGIEHAATHNGGRLAFGPDGMLYTTTGDAREDLAFQGPQDTVRLLGKILRMNPDGTRPTDNPYTDSLVWSMGHRNVQGIAWAPDGTMYASEFGQDTWDELNIISKGGNYGWPEVEGIAGDTRFIDPIAQWETAQASPSGIAVHDGKVYIANLRGSVLRWVTLDDPPEQGEVLDESYGRIRDVVVSSAGELLFLTNNTDGRGDPRADDDVLVRIGTAN